MTKESEARAVDSVALPKDDRPRPKQEKNTTSSLQSLFDAIRVRVLMEEAKPGSGSLEKLKELEEKLESPDVKIKESASNQLQELIQIKVTADARAEKIETVAGLLDVAKIDDTKKADLRDVAEQIDNLFVKASAHPERITDTEIEGAHSGLERIASNLGVKENSIGLEEAAARLSWLQTSKEARQFIADREVYSSPVKEYEGEFEASGAPKILKLREVPADQADSLQRKLDTFKQHVSEELIEVDPRKIEDLTADDLVNRLEETTYWQANMKHLQGRRHWEGTKNINELRDVLGRVEAQYQALLEEKMVNNVVAKPGNEGVNPNFVRESLTQSLRARRRYLRTEYDFDKGVDHGKKRSDVLLEEVEKGAKKIEQNTKRRSLPVGNSDTHSGRQRQYLEELNGSRDQFDDVEYSPEEMKQRKELMDERQEQVGVVHRKLGIDPRMVTTLRKSAALRAEMLQRAENSLTPAEFAVYSREHSFWESHAMGGMRGELSPIQDELEALKATKQYNKFSIKLKAYVERVGLREASSDWDFAIMMREAKEEISRVSPDAGEKLDQWQEALFAPSMTTLDEKSFFEVMPKMMSQSRLEHELSPKYANWEAMQVVLPDGSKKVVSVASFYQLLQRQDVAKKILNAPTNGNDTAIHEVLVEHIWGKGATVKMSPRDDLGLTPSIEVTLADGTKVENVKINYFSVVNNKFDPEQSETLGLEDFVDQSMWMTHYAKTLWHYSGEWEPFLRDFPGDQLTQANKRLMAIGAAFRDYGLDYGKFDVGYAELAKAGVLLQDFRTYKANDVLKANIRHLMVEKDENGHQVADWKRGDEISSALWKMVQKRASISDHYHPVIGMRSVEEIRLMGNLPSSEEQSWNWFKASQEKLGRTGVLDFAQIQALRGKDINSLSATEEGWVVQANEINKWVADLAKQRAEIGGMNPPLTREELLPLLNKQSLLTTGEPYTGEVSLDAYLRSFEYSSIIDHAQLKKGTDPLDYKNYSLAKQEAAKLMTEVLSGSPTLETITGLYNAMKGYMPPEQLMAWFEEYMKTKVRLRTNQIVSYDIAMTDLEWWHKQNPDAKRKGIHPPETIMGINPATYKIKDENGDSWNVVGADGFKVTKMKKEWGNHMLKTRDIPGLTAKDIEIQMKLFVGNRWLPNKEVGEEILEGSLGLGQTIDRFYKNRGWKGNNKGVAKFLKKWGTKGVLLLRKHPLFDDPVWAFWSILNEFKEFGEEVGKEMEKELVGGHH